jgi:pyruvate-formate lyase-activating enzyme
MELANSNCEYCSNYEYDEYYEYYTCTVNLDEDEMSRFLRGNYKDCPYFSYNDEYKIARRQM